LEPQISPSTCKDSSTQYILNKKKQYTVLAIALSALIIDALTVRSISLLAPFIRSDLGIDKSQFGYIFSSFMVGAMITTLPAGIIIGRLNINKAFSAIMTALGLTLIVVARQTSLFGFMIALFFVGLVRTGIPSLVNRVITEQFDPKQRGAIMGFIYAAIPFGGFIGAIILPTLGEFINWNTGYHLMGGASLLVALITWKLAPKESRQSNHSQPAKRIFSFQSSSFLILCFTYGLYGLSMTSEAFITLYLVDIVKISALIAGIFYGIMQLTGVGGRVFWGLLADRYFSHNRWWLLSATNWLMVISFTFLTLLRANSPWWLIVAIMVGLGLSAASSWGILWTLLGDVVVIDAIAIATATIYFVVNTGDVLGPVLFGYTLKQTNSYQITMRLFVCMTIVSALVFTWMAFRKKPMKSE